MVKCIVKFAFSKLIFSLNIEPNQSQVWNVVKASDAMSLVLVQVGLVGCNVTWRWSAIE